MCLASLLHYDVLRHVTPDTNGFEREGNVEYLRSGRGFSRIQEAGLAEVKGHLAAGGVACRV